MATTARGVTSFPSRVESSVADVALVRVVLLGALVVLVPLASASIVWTDTAGDDNLNRAVTLAPFDLALVGLLALWVSTGGARRLVRRPTTVAGHLAWALAAVVATSFVANPSPRGIEWVVRVVAGFAIVDTWRAVPAFQRRKLLGVIAGMGSAQSLLAMLQSARGEAFGIEYIDYGWRLYQFGSSHAGRGGLTHPYHLVAFLLVALAAGIMGLRHADRQGPWLVALALCGAGVGVTYSRASLLALIPSAVLVLFVAGRSATRALAYGALAAALGFAFSAATFGDGWYARYEQSTGTNASSGRTTLWSDAIDMAADHAVVGVGPGRYTIALSERSYDGQLLPAHNVVLHYAAELGVIGGALVAALAYAVAIAVARRGPIAALPAIGLAPFFLLDAYPYTFTTGLAITALAAAIATTAEERELA